MNAIQRLVCFFFISNTAYRNDYGGSGDSGDDFCCCFDYFNFIFIVFDILIFDYLFPWCVPYRLIWQSYNAIAWFYCLLKTLNACAIVLFCDCVLSSFIFYFILSVSFYFSTHQIYTKSYLLYYTHNNKW